MARSRRDDDDERPIPKKKPQIVDDDDDDEPAPPRKKPRVSDGDDEHPAKKKSPGKKSRGGDDDAPPKNTKKKSRATGGGNKKLLIIGGAVAGFLFLCGGGITLAVYLISGITVPKIASEDTPQKAVEEFFKATDRRDGAGMWDRMDQASQDKMSAGFESMKSRPEGAKYKGKTGREIYIAMMDEAKFQGGGGGATGMSKPNFVSFTPNDDGVSGKVLCKSFDGQALTIPVVKEGDKWKLSFSGEGLQLLK